MDPPPITMVHPDRRYDFPSSVRQGILKRLCGCGVPQAALSQSFLCFEDDVQYLSIGSETSIEVFLNVSASSFQVMRRKLKLLIRRHALHPSCLADT